MTGRGFVNRDRSIAVGLAAARPNQRVTLVDVIEEIGVDGCIEARIVELKREVIAALAGALRPGRPDLDPGDIDPMIGASSFMRFISGTMRTPLACKSR